MAAEAPGQQAIDEVVGTDGILEIKRFALLMWRYLAGFLVLVGLLGLLVLGGLGVGGLLRSRWGRRDVGCFALVRYGAALGLGRDFLLLGATNGHRSPYSRWKREGDEVAGRYAFEIVAQGIPPSSKNPTSTFYA